LVDQSQGYYFGVVPSMAFCNSGEFIVAKLGNFFCNFVRFYFAINIESMKNNKVQYLPIRARSKDESEVLDLYLVNICNIVDALDLENSKYSVHEIDENEKMISVQKYAIKGSVIKDIDLFRLKDHYI